MMKSSSLRNNIASGVGIPGDYSPPSRFVRATYLEKNIPHLNSAKDYAYLLHNILNTVTVPYSDLSNSTATLWQTQKDLNANTISYINILYLYNGKLIVADNNITTYNIDQIFSTGIGNINAKNKLSSKITNADKYKYYTIDQLTSHI